MRVRNVSPDLTMDTERLLMFEQNCDIYSMVTSMSQSSRTALILGCSLGCLSRQVLLCLYLISLLNILTHTSSELPQLQEQKQEILTHTQSTTIKITILLSTFLSHNWFNSSSCLSSPQLTHIRSNEHVG